MCNYFELINYRKLTVKTYAIDFTECHWFSRLANLRTNLRNRTLQFREDLNIEQAKVEIGSKNTNFSVVGIIHSTILSNSYFIISIKGIHRRTRRSRSHMRIANGTDFKSVGLT